MRYQKVSILPSEKIACLVTVSFTRAALQLERGKVRKGHQLRLQLPIRDPTRHRLTSAAIHHPAAPALPENQALSEARDSPATPRPHQPRKKRSYTPLLPKQWRCTITLPSIVWPECTLIQNVLLRKNEENETLLNLLRFACLTPASSSPRLISITLICTLVLRAGSKEMLYSRTAKNLHYELHVRISDLEPNRPSRTSSMDSRQLKKVGQANTTEGEVKTRPATLEKYWQKFQAGHDLFATKYATQLNQHE